MASPKSSLFPSDLDFHIPTSVLEFTLPYTVRKLYQEIQALVGQFIQQNNQLLLERHDLLLRICDEINGLQTRCPSYAEYEQLLECIVESLRVLLLSASNNRVYNAVIVQDALVKNCSYLVRSVIGGLKNMRTLSKVALRHLAFGGVADAELAYFIADVLQAWGEAFEPTEELYPNIPRIYRALKQIHGFSFVRPDYDPTRVPIFLPSIPREGAREIRDYNKRNGATASVRESEVHEEYSPSTDSSTTPRSAFGAHEGTYARRKEDAVSTTDVCKSPPEIVSDEHSPHRPNHTNVMNEPLAETSQLSARPTALSLERTTGSIRHTGLNSDEDVVVNTPQPSNKLNPALVNPPTDPSRNEDVQKTNALIRYMGLDPTDISPGCLEQVHSTQTNPVREFSMEERECSTSVMASVVDALSPRTEAAMHARDSEEGQPDPMNSIGTRSGAAAQSRPAEQCVEISGSANEKYAELSLDSVPPTQLSVDDKSKPSTALINESAELNDPKNAAEIALEYVHDDVSHTSGTELQKSSLTHSNHESKILSYAHETRETPSHLVISSLNRQAGNEAIPTDTRDSSKKPVSAVDALRSRKTAFTAHGQATGKEVVVKFFGIQRVLTRTGPPH